MASLAYPSIFYDTVRFIQAMATAGSHGSHSTAGHHHRIIIRPHTHHSGQRALCTAVGDALAAGNNWCAPREKRLFKSRLACAKRSLGTAAGRADNSPVSESPPITAAPHQQPRFERSPWHVLFPGRAAGRAFPERNRGYKIHRQLRVFFLRNRPASRTDLAFCCVVEASNESFFLGETERKERNPANDRKGNLPDLKSWVLLLGVWAAANIHLLHFAFSDRKTASWASKCDKSAAPVVELLDGIRRCAER